MKKLARVHATAGLVSVLSLALLTGCSGSGSGSDDEKGSVSGKDAPSSSAAVKALSEAELKGLLVTAADVKGYKVEPSNTDKGQPGTRDKVTSAKAECLPIALAVSGFGPGDPAAETRLKVTEDKGGSGSDKPVEDMTNEEFQESFSDSMDISSTNIALSSHEGEGAAKTMAAVTAAIEACGKGFEMSFGGSQKVTEVVSEKSSAGSADSVAFAVTVAAESTDEATVHGEVVRHGNTLATYYSLNLQRLVDGKPYAIPADVVKEIGRAHV